MKIKVTGINGYIGQLISKELTSRNHNVSAIKRELLYSSGLELQNELRACDVVINLAGAPILQRWTKRNKKSIYDSRIETTKNLVKAINELSETERPKKFISTSAIGIYQNDTLHNEISTNFDKGFVGKVGKDWEDALIDLPNDIQKNIFRISLVLGKNAKTITKLVWPFKLGLGGKIGSGKQAFPFVHEKDVVNAFVWAVDAYDKSGVFNLVAPQKITNSEFSQAFANKLKRPSFIPVPAFILKLILGEASTLLLKSPIVEPMALLEAGFEFEYSDIDLALDDILD